MQARLRSTVVAFPSPFNHPLRFRLAVAASAAELRRQVSELRRALLAIRAQRGALPPSAAGSRLTTTRRAQLRATLPVGAPARCRSTAGKV